MYAYALMPVQRSAMRPVRGPVGGGALYVYNEAHRTAFSDLLTTTA
jgi:hypothetical protein